MKITCTEYNPNTDTFTIELRRDCDNSLDATVLITYIENQDAVISVNTARDSYFNALEVIGKHHDQIQDAMMIMIGESPYSTR